MFNSHNIKLFKIGQWDAGLRILSLENTKYLNIRDMLLTDLLQVLNNKLQYTIYKQKFKFHFKKNIFFILFYYQKFILNERDQIIFHKFSFMFKISNVKTQLLFYQSYDWIWITL